MKSIIQIHHSNSSLGLVPFKNQNKLNSNQDLPLLFPEADLRDSLPKPITVVNMSVHHFKPNKRDNRKIKEAVTVKRMKLLCKENIDVKKIANFLNRDHKRASLNFSASRDQNRKKNDQPVFQMMGKPLPHQNEASVARTFSGPLQPHNSFNRLKLDRIEKQNELGATIFESKPLVSNNKSEALINIKLKAYINFVKDGRKLHNLNQELCKDAKKKGLRVKIKRGNNSQLVKWLFKKRWWWNIQEEKDDKDKIRPNFIWSQLKQKSFFEIMPTPQTDAETEGAYDQYCHNHFPQNEYLGNKKALFYNMTHYYKSKKIDVFDRLPLTFHVTSIQDQSWKQFSQKFEDQKKEGTNNIWILKPGENSNRGRGITVHQSYQQIKSIICSGDKFTDTHDDKQKNRTYIIQAYIDKPFLYNKRKFDIRCYMLLVNINKSVKGYWYTEGYIRTSSFQFQLSDFNSFVHLTNDAIQNHSQNYGKFQEGNKLSYAQFQKYLDAKHAGSGLDLEKQIVPKMKEIAADSMRAAVHLAKGQRNDRPVFEVFGLDFMIDRNFKPWLIEINTNPCIETSCLVLEKIIPRMLDDALKLSLDLLFPPPQNWPPSKKHCLPSSNNRFELVYQQDKEQGIQQVEMPSLGVITEDGEFYQENKWDSLYYSRPVSYQSYYKKSRPQVLPFHDPQSQEVLRFLKEQGINVIDLGGLARGIRFDDVEVGRRHYNHNSERVTDEFFIHQWKPTNDRAKEHPVGTHLVFKNFGEFMSKLSQLIAEKRKKY